MTNTIYTMSRALRMKILRIQKIGCEIAKLQEESRLLRKEIGEAFNVQEEPTHIYINGQVFALSKERGGGKDYNVLSLKMLNLGEQESK